MGKIDYPIYIHILLWENQEYLKPPTQLIHAACCQGSDNSDQKLQKRVLCHNKNSQDPWFTISIFPVIKTFIKF
jgi:hypothetical protein